MCEAYLSIVRTNISCVYQRLRLYGWSETQPRIGIIFRRAPAARAADAIIPR